MSDRSSAFTAQYHSTCPLCEELIVPGVRVQWLDKEVVHAKECDPFTRRVEARPAVVCERCWLTKPCECDA